MAIEHYEVTFETLHETFGLHEDIVVAHASGVGDLIAAGNTFEEALRAIKTAIAWRHVTREPITRVAPLHVREEWGA